MLGHHGAVYNLCRHVLYAAEDGRDGAIVMRTSLMVREGMYMLRWKYSILDQR